MAATLMEKRYAKALAEYKQAQADLKRAQTKFNEKKRRLAYYRQRGQEAGIEEGNLPEYKLPKRTVGERSRAMDPAFVRVDMCDTCGKALYSLKGTAVFSRNGGGVHSSPSKDDACAFLKQLTKGAKP